MSELKPCPKCGGQAKIADKRQWIAGRNNGGLWKYIYCLSCGYKSGLYFWDDRKDLIDIWNRRVVEDD